ncbi:MAG: GntR family transcriptional regulator [Chryseobacterium sp.]|nr:MAG: GntR family transcriptional regulator [Chryseobacterium sp.]
MKESHFNSTSNVTLLAQVVNSIQKNIENGTYQPGSKLSSINWFSKKNGVSRDTIEKAYIKLRKAGFVESIPGKGYFVASRKNSDKLNVLLLFNKLSNYKQVVYNSFMDKMKERANVDLHIYNYNPTTFKDIIDKNLGQYHYYVIMPHFFQDTNPEEYISTIQKIPREQLILLDKGLEDLPDQKGVYQDFEGDIYQALLTQTDPIGKYNEIELVFPENRHHPMEIIAGVRRFCEERNMDFVISNELSSSALENGKLFIVLTEDHLAMLIKMVRQSPYQLGKNLGIISFNETIFKELLDITVITTDFE